jgi:hypothetical protein
VIIDTHLPRRRHIERLRKFFVHSEKKSVGAALSLFALNTALTPYLLKDLARDGALETVRQFWTAWTGRIHEKEAAANGFRYCVFYASWFIRAAAVYATGGSSDFDRAVAGQGVYVVREQHNRPFRINSLSPILQQKDRPKAAAAIAT